MTAPKGSRTLRLGVAGLGTVGGGLLKLIERQDELRLPGKLVVTAVSARSRTRNRGVDISKLRWVDDPVELAGADDVDVVVELIGGSDGPAKRTVEAALKAGKAVVSANKALIAEHGIEIAELAEAHHAHLLFEAAVAGAIPIVRAIRNSLSGVVVEPRLRHSQRHVQLHPVGDAAHRRCLRDRARGGAAARLCGEPIPILDVSGMDAAHKVLILASIAFGAQPDFSQVQVEGVDKIEAMDITLANKFDYRIKLVAEAFRRRMARMAAASAAASRRCWCTGITRSPRSTARSTPSWSKANLSAA